MAKVSGRIRQIVFARANHYCEYCRCSMHYTTDLEQIEHIIPIAVKGSHELSNLALSCSGCNIYKHTFVTGMDPATGEEVFLYHPRQQIWAEHFAWSNDYLLIIGTTPTGRATVERLKVNRKNVQNLRRALMALGEHPPII